MFTNVVAFPEDHFSRLAIGGFTWFPSEHPFLLAVGLKWLLNLSNAFPFRPIYIFGFFLYLENT